MNHRIAIGLVCAAASFSFAQTVQIQVKADSGRIPISPWIYGRNNSMSDDPSKPAAAADIALYKEAGLRATRETGGNNCTRYNWRKKLISHPDWYNNVYDHDWDFDAMSIQQNLPGVQGVFGFQLLGWVASNKDHNFDDGSYNNYAYWSGVAQNLAGGGTPNGSGGGVATVQGNALLYSQVWPADSSAAILGSWFGPGGAGLDSTRFRYWGMDNEPEIWNGTHDDIDTLVTGHTLTAEEYVQRWAAMAKAARKLFPGVKLVGPASPSEWQWYTWPNEHDNVLRIQYKGGSFCWPEYLIKRLAEIQDSTGVRMLDVYDVHLYYQASNKTDAFQTHRLLWDPVYIDPNANGVKTVYGDQWNDTVKHQAFFYRTQKWLDKYFGKGNGVRMGATESGIDSCVSNHASPTAVWYASQLGTFADHGAELFTAWSWYDGMWEVMHLFSRYARTTRVQSVSSLDSLVSAYSSISQAGDSMTVVLVNRAQSGARTALVSLNGFVPSGAGTTLQLSDLIGETFKSHARNALASGTVSVTAGSFSLSLPALSVTAVVFAGTGNAVSSVHAAGTRSGAVHAEYSGRVLRLENGPGSGIAVLRNLSGSLVASSDWSEGRASFDLAKLARGVYLAAWDGGAIRVPVASN